MPPDEPLDPTALREALDVVLTWGPERMRPEHERLLERMPGHDDREVEGCLQIAHRVLERAEGLAPALKGVGPVDDSVAQLRADHPWLTDDLLERALQQGMYFDWRDNGR